VGAGGRRGRKEGDETVGDEGIGGEVEVVRG
jgi:hypothetical protein